MFNPRLINGLQQRPTPFYFYDLDVLNRSLQQITLAAQPYNYHLHYALKANANPRILETISSYGLGADCVSGNEIKLAIQSGFAANEIVFAGVGKTDKEILYALEQDILMFNVESVQELEVIDQLAASVGKIAPIALRINPGVDAHTHPCITTGLEVNKFGIGLQELENLADLMPGFKNLRFTGLHFHIGSQITELEAYEHLCLKVNDIQQLFAAKGYRFEHLNMGGGLGVDYHHPEILPDFEAYFNVFRNYLKTFAGQQVHFEPGRAIVAQTGTLITRALYHKPSGGRNFIIVDAGFTELLRPALYNAYHKIENLTSTGQLQCYDVAGPICESTDVLGRDVELNECRRGDLLAIRSAGAYGEVMASGYNQRELNASVFSSGKGELFPSMLLKVG